MQLSDINPFMRFAGLQPSVLSSKPTYVSYDYRIFYILDGSGYFFCLDKRFPISTGSIVYFRPETPYYFEGKVKVIVLNFDMTRFNSDKTEPLPPSSDIETFIKELVIENDPPAELQDPVILEKAFEIEEKMQECLSHYTYHRPYSDAFTSAILKEILCYIVQRANPKPNITSEIVQKITLYISQNYYKEISNTDISKQLGYHPFYLNRIFKKSTGITIHKAVINEKMRVAKRMLRETDISIKEVAEETGFPDRTGFCTAFKKHTGYTPLEYRNRKS